MAQSNAPVINIFGDDNAVKILPQQGPSIQGNVINGRVFFGNGVAIDGRGVVTPTRSSRPEMMEPALADYPHSVVFQDGRRMRGKVVSLDAMQLELSRPGALQPLRFLRSEVRRVDLDPERESAETGSQGWAAYGGASAEGNPQQTSNAPVHATVKLAGANWLRGDLGSVDGEAFVLKIGANGSIAIPRAGIDWIRFGTSEAPAFGLYGNLSDLEGWRGPGVQSHIKSADGVLTFARGAWISHPVPPLPTLPRFELAVTLPAGAEENTRLWLQPFETMGPNSYTTGTMLIGFGAKELSHCIDIDAFQSKKTPVPEAAQGGEGAVAYRILYDGPAQRLLVFRNGRQAAEWSLQNPATNQLFQNAGVRGIKGVCLDRIGAHNELSITEFQAKPWNGALPEPNDPVRTADILTTHDNMRRTGKLQSISGKTLTFGGKRFVLGLPALVEFPRPPPPPQADATTRVILKGSGELSASDLVIAGDVARWRTSFSTSVEAPAQAIARICFPGSPARDEFLDTLVFKNGDELAGSLATAAPGMPLVWRLMSRQEARIDPGQVAGVRFAASRLPIAPGDTPLAELRGGDLLCADLIDFDGAKLNVDHPSLGQRSIPAAKLLRLYPSTTALYLASRDPETWLGKPHAGALGVLASASRTRNPSIYLDGSYLSRTVAAAPNEAYRAFAIDSSHLTVPLRQPPGQFEISFNATNLYGASPEFGLSLGGEDMSSIQISGDQWGHIQAMLNWSVLGQKSRFQLLPMGDKMVERSTRVNLRLFVKSQPGTADIFLDGLLAAQIGHGSSHDASHESETLPALGKSISFQLSPDTVLSDIIVRPWNGEQPAPGSTQPQITLGNGDVAHGALKGIADGKFYLQSELGPLALNAPTVQMVDFGGEPTPQRAAARVRLPDGSAIHLDSFHWLGRELAAHSPVLGDLLLPASAVSELVFNPEPSRPPHVILPAPVKKSGASGKEAGGIPF